ncbi:MAG: N-acetylmuramoyl-L-alanine amidase [Candidatus Omnitrophica bacterium]|nr:N-acetylmuramoyl-L-alanine amidase [Candidatus Omnitrophota bacterium]
MQYQRPDIKDKEFTSKIGRFELGCAILISAFCILNLTGCATVPRGQLNLPVYYINGAKYFPVISYCELKNIGWDYDTFTKSLTLKRGGQQVSLAVGSPLAVVNGTSRNIKLPVNMYGGAVAAPYRFKEDVLDLIFKEEVRPKADYFVSRGRFRKIVIDAGHGGKDSGAVGRYGLQEKKVVLDIAKKLSHLLKEAGYDIIMTRDDDTFIPLSSRAGIANRNNADLFVSIHANANRSRNLYGFEVYYVSPYLNDTQRALSAAENAGLGNIDICPASGSKDLKATVWDLVYTSNRAESIDLAKYICNQARGSLSTRIIGIKGAPFYVLKNTQMPSLLVEVGFVSNAKEEKMLKSGLYREKLAETIAQAIKQFCRDYSLIEAGVK